jgi:hypothetical protein
MNATQRACALAHFLAPVGFLLGCSPEPPKAEFTVDEYLANPAAMNAKLKECANNPGDLRDDPDCTNVKAAAERQGVGSLRDLPPLGLEPSEDNGRSERSASNPGSRSAQ